MAVAINTDPLFQAAVLAGSAPSLHNTQPWRWRVHGNRLDLVLERARVLHSTDPHARLATLSCGTALHHARLHHAASGWHATVRRFPDPANGDHLARLLLDRPAPVDQDALRLLRAVARRQTDRRVTPGAPLDFDRLRPVTTAARREGADLKLLRPRQVFDLAEAFNRAQSAVENDSGRLAELAGSVTASHTDTIGIPAPALTTDRWTVIGPGHGLHRSAATLIGESHHHASIFAILHGIGDSSHDWLRAGEALSACWLTADRVQVSLLPQSFAIEVPAARELVRELLEPTDSPYLVLRFASAEPHSGTAPRTPRLPAEAFIEREEADHDID
jgi:hypothetical protein